MPASASPACPKPSPGHVAPPAADRVAPLRPLPSSPTAGGCSRSSRTGGGDRSRMARLIAASIRALLAEITAIAHRAGDLHAPECRWSSRRSERPLATLCPDFLVPPRRCLPAPECRPGRAGRNAIRPGDGPHGGPCREITAATEGFHRRVAGGNGHRRRRADSRHHPEPGGKRSTLGCCLYLPVEFGVPRGQAVDLTEAELRHALRGVPRLRRGAQLGGGLPALACDVPELREMSPQPDDHAEAKLPG